MKTTQNILYIFFSASLLMVSCHDLLDQEPISRAIGDTFWETEADVEKGIAGNYALLRDALANGVLFQYGDLTADLFRKGWNAGNDAFYLPGDYSTATSNQREWGSPSMWDFQDWTRFYKVINFSNVAINRIANMPLSAFGNNERARDRYLGQAYFIRGLTYFLLVRIWGDVPLINRAVDATEQAIDEDGNPVEVPRSPEKEVLELALDDGKRASSLLRYGNPADFEWGIHANKGSAQALEGHVALWIASRADQGQASLYLDIATAAIDSLMAFGNYTLSSYADEQTIKDVFVGQSGEAIFELLISANHDESFRIDQGQGIEGLTALYPTRELDNNYNRVYWLPFEKKTDVFEDGVSTTDPRADLFFRAWTSTRTEPARDNPGLWIDVTCLKKFENMTEDDQALNGEFRAFFANSNVPVFRYTGLILLGAEAYAKKGNYSKAKELLKMIRDRIGLDMPSVPDTELVLEILRERRRELIGEGHIFFDRVRNNHFEGVSAMSPVRIERNGYFWPVRYRNIRKNPALEQTSYWIGKVSDN